MKNLKIDTLSNVEGGGVCFYLGVGAVLSALGGPVTFAVANLAIAGAAAYAGCL